MSEDDTVLGFELVELQQDLLSNRKSLSIRVPVDKSALQREIEKTRKLYFYIKSRELTEFDRSVKTFLLAKLTAMEMFLRDMYPEKSINAPTENKEGVTMPKKPNVASAWNTITTRFRKWKSTYVSSLLKSLGKMAKMAFERM